jgi:DNA polymerase-3 subunit beta
MTTATTIKVPLKPFAAAFSAVSAAVPSRSPIEALKYVRAEVHQDRETLSLYATDSNVSLRVELRLPSLAEPCVALLPAELVSSLLRELDGDEIGLEFSANTTSVVITSGSNEWKLSTALAADFPPVKTLADTPTCTVSVADLKRCLTRTVFATDAASMRYALGGVLIEVGPERATFAATDSRRLAVDSCQAELNKPGSNVAGVVPQKAVKLIVAAMNGETAVIAMSDSAMSVNGDGVTVTAQLVQGRFPDFRKVIPNRFNATMETVVGPLYSAVRQSQIVTNKETGVEFIFADGVLRLSSQAADVGQSKIELPISYDLAKMTLTVDPRYVADFLRVLDDADLVEVNLIDHESPVLLTCGGYQYVVMPLSNGR